MRRIVLLLPTVALLCGACTLSQPRARVEEPAPAHTPPRSTSVLGDWVLGTPPDSTAFTGARLVELSLQPSTFTINVYYPGQQQPLVITGTASVYEDGGPLTLTPQAVARGAGRADVPTPLVPGQSVSVMATAADNTMVFAPLDGVSVLPSSVWHRKNAARAAGIVPSVSAGEVTRDTTRRGKKP